MTDDTRYRVRVDAEETSVSLRELIALAREGKIAHDTRVRPPGGDWCQAAALPEVAEVLQSDPWSAWDEMDEETAETAIQAYVRPTGPVDFDLFDPTEPVDPELPEPQVEMLPEMLPDSAVDPMSETDRSPPPPRRGQVIAFPGPARDGGVRGATALKTSPDHRAEIATLPRRDLPQISDLSQLRDQRPAPRVPRIRWGPLTAFASLMVAGIVSLNIYMETVVTQKLGRAAPRSATDASVGAPPVPGPTEAGPAAAEPIEVSSKEPNVDVAIERDLRDRMTDRPQEIREPGDLEDALLIELKRMPLADLRVKARVLTWSTGRHPAPEVAEIVVDLTPEELDREIAAVALVVGRYIHRLALDVRRLDLRFRSNGALVALPIAPEQARAFYRRKISLAELLAD